MSTYNLSMFFISKKKENQNSNHPYPSPPLYPAYQQHPWTTNSNHLATNPPPQQCCDPSLLKHL